MMAPKQSNDSHEVKTKMENDDPSAHKLLFEVVSTRTVYTPAKFVEYTVKIRKPSFQSDDHPSLIERRYSEFLELFIKLREEFPEALASFSFPKKAIIGNFSPQVISLRRGGFESFLLLISSHDKIKESPTLIDFLHKKEQNNAIQFIQDKNFKMAVVQLENIFRLLNKLLTDRHPTVLRILCLLVACCDASGHASTRHYLHTAIVRFEAVSDIDTLRYYVPLLQLSVRTLQDSTILEERLACMKRRGVKVDGCPSLLDLVMSDFSSSSSSTHSNNTSS